MPTTYAIPQGNQYFSPVLWTGNGSAQTIGGLNFSPDLTWIKSRSVSGNHHLFNTVMAAGTYPAVPFLQTNNTNAQAANGDKLDYWTSNGFHLGGSGEVDGNGVTFTAWNWLGGGAAVTNTNGSITSSISANPTSGFSIVTYTGTGANATVGHGLSTAPQMVVVKNRQTAGTSWKTYHIGLTSAAYAMEMETTGAQASTPACWNSTAPTSTVVNLGSNAGVNESGKTHMMLCFAPVAGFSALGKYTGNGSSDGPFIYLGFRPAYIMVKRSDSTGAWFVLDNKRDTYNYAYHTLNPNASDSEYSSTSNAYDFLSNGFKLRQTNADQNASGGTYIYMAFAENPFKYANAR